jgi:hypothetical protein
MQRFRMVLRLALICFEATSLGGCSSLSGCSQFLPIQFGSGQNSARHLHPIRQHSPAAR